MLWLPQVCLCCVLAVAFVAYALEFWIHDVNVCNGGYVEDKWSGNTPTWVSHIVVDILHPSKKLGGPKVIWPVMVTTK